MQQLKVIINKNFSIIQQEKKMIAGDEEVKKIHCADSTKENEEEELGNILSNSKLAQKRHRGWKAMPYILGNESFERLATLGLMANFMVYLVKEFHQKMVSAANIINIWVSISSFAPLIGGFVSDAYAGRFKSIAFGSFACLLGMLTMTLTAWLPQLHPPKCNVTEKNCRGPNSAQMGVLLLGLGFLSVGTGGIRPCSIPFGIDQFDQTTEEGVKGMNSFFNLYYIILTLIVLISKLVVVYIQDSVSWVVGFGIPALLMLCAIIVFFIGKKVYVIVAPQGSVFSGVAQVFVAAFKKRHLKLPQEDKVGLFYDPPSKVPLKLPFTNQFRIFNKGAMIVGHELKPDGTPINHWRLCSVQQVEEVKCVIKTLPISASAIVGFISITQQSTFIISQAMKMDRHIGTKFEIPAGSIVAITYLTIVIWVLFYDRVLVPALRKITKHEGGITVLQRCGIGNIFSILSMVAAGLVEKKRRDWANLHPENPPLYVMWLTPPLVLMGLSEGFGYIGMLEFYNKEFPDSLRSIGNSLVFCGYGAASYLSSLMVTIIHETTGKQGRPDWLANDINAGKLDYFYFVIAAMGVFNLIYFLLCARWYRYKGSVKAEEKSVDIEQAGSIKP